MAGEVNLHFACSCKNHSCKITKLKRALVLRKMHDTVIIPYDLSIQLGIVKIMCHEKEGAKIG